MTASEDDANHLSAHEAATLEALCAQLAEALEWEYGGWRDPHAAPDAAAYFVPHDLLSPDNAARAGIAGADDLFGGVVPYPFLRTKVISHGLAHAAAAAPTGWSEALAGRMVALALPGFSAFSRADALMAAEALLRDGPVRLKAAHARGGNGQRVAADLSEAVAILDEYGATLREGVVLERDLAQIRTHSVGQVDLPGLTVSYHGSQHCVRNRRGAEVYGGSDLRVVRGPISELARHGLAGEAAMAVALASRYDQALRECFPDAFSSRRNYDVAMGKDHAGARQEGVLEHSWRIGGASAAEIAAIARLRRDPAREWVQASTHEVYDAPAPPGARVHFSGEVAGEGHLTKYVEVGADGG